MKPLGASDPQAIGSYQLLGVLGSGGMGRVYLGQSRTGRRVAIKVIRPDLAEDPVFRDRFTREVAAARLVSPLFTAAVVDADTRADAPWLATTFIDGIGLDRRVLDQGRMSAQEVLSLAAGLGEALLSIHGVGLVHRDLKPSNILLNASGPHIIDFGLALGTEQSRLTTSLVVGTPSYMAPERLRGDDAGPPSDIFSLGATLVFAATGRDLVDDATVYQQVLQIAEGRFNLSDVPPKLRAIIVRCVSFEPRDRPTAAELTRFVVALGAVRPTGDTTEVVGTGAGWPAGEDTGSGDFAPPVRPVASPQSPLPQRTPGSPPPKRTPLVVRPHTTPPDSGNRRGLLPDQDHAITPSGVTVVPVDEPPRWSRRRLLVGGGVVGTAVAVGAVVLAVDALAHQQTGSGVSTGGPSTAGGPGGPTGSPGAGRPSTAPTPGQLLWPANSGARPPSLPQTFGVAGRTALVTPAGLLISVLAKGVTATPVQGGGRGWNFPTKTGTGALIWRWGDDLLVVDGTSLTLLDIATGKQIKTVVPVEMLPGAALPAQHPPLTLGLGVAVDDARAYVGLGPVTIALDRKLDLKWWQRMDGVKALGLFEVPTASGGDFVVTQLATPLINVVKLRSAATGAEIWTDEFTVGGLDVTAPPLGAAGPGGAGGGRGQGGSGGGIALGLPNLPADPATLIAEARVTARYMVARFGPELRVYATARSSATMRQHWPSPISSIEIIGGSLAVASAELGLYDLATGSALWKHGGNGGRLGMAQSPPVIVVADQEEIIGVDPKSGNVGWTTPLPAVTLGAVPIEVTTGPHAAYVTYGPRTDGRMPDDDVLAVAT